ncbi:MAG TPA: patatin-like phospholipase family protein, partial [Acidimicrobiales bacterium]|nr:patatin-like phospholipase family protein [Acidimicrobiales bacterium]
ASGIKAVDPALIGRPGLELRMAVAALGDGVLRYVTQDGHIVASDAVTPVAGPVDVLEGMLASASVPLLFPPRQLAGDVYVDGGVANNIPVDAAVRLGADRVFAVLAVPVLQPPDRRDFTTAAAPAVFLRAVGAIAFAERQLANLNPPLPVGTTVTVIDPLVDVVGPFEVSQGLMLLDMDYGWMRAADVLADVDGETRRRAVAATDAVVVARTQAWHREEAFWGSGKASAGDLRALRETKCQVREAVAERKGLGLPMPPAAEQWWSAYEVHAGPIPDGLPDDPSAGWSPMG